MGAGRAIWVGQTLTNRQPPYCASRGLVDCEADQPCIGGQPCNKPVRDIFWASNQCPRGLPGYKGMDMGCQVRLFRVLCTHDKSNANQDLLGRQRNHVIAVDNIPCFVHHLHAASHGTVCTRYEDTQIQGWHRWQRTGSSGCQADEYATIANNKVRHKHLSTIEFQGQSWPFLFCWFQVIPLTLSYMAANAWLPTRGAPYV